MEVDDDIDDSSGGIEGEQPQSSSGKVCKDMRSITTGEIVGKPLQSFRSNAYNHTSTKLSESLEDGHSWRKVGSKFILDANFPRCVHKHDQGCQATKQVQRIDKKPDVYPTTCTLGCSVTNSSMNNQGDFSIQFGVDDINGSSVDEPLRPSNDEVFKHKRNSQKRGVIPIWTKQSESFEDEYNWRKYGQKEIHGAKFPREYFRCIHRHYLGCLAIRQVQRDDEEPSLYNIIYRGHHTCTQTSIVTNSSMNSQVDLRTQSGIDDDDIHDHAESTASRSSSLRIYGDQKQIANRSCRKLFISGVSMESSDEQMDFNDSEAHVVTKMEPPTKQALDPFAKMEKTGTVETFDFPQGEKVEPFVKAEPFGLPKIDTPKTHYYFPKARTAMSLRIPQIESTIRLLQKMSRIRDFIRLLLSYPMRTVHDSKLKAWIHEASNRRYFLDDLNHLLSQKPLNCFQGLLPMYILENVERGWSPKYADSNGSPDSILSLAANLAVDQLIQTLLFEDDHVRNIHHVLFSTKDAAEKRLVKKKIESMSKDKEIMLRLHETFTGVLLIDASDYQGLAAEIHVQKQIAQQLHLPIIASIEKEMSRKKYLVLLVDGEAKEPLDPRKVGFPAELAGVVVCITTESSKQANSELTVAMDLNINTKDHLLPWEVFCANIGTTILPSSYAERMAVHIVEECGGHLLAGIIVAKSLRNEKHEDWEHALYKLRSLHPSYDIRMFQGQSSVLLKVFINFIWLYLSKTQKYCLTSCLFDSKFGKLENELINDWISSRLVVAREARHNLRELVDRFALLQLEDTRSRYIQIPQETYAILQLLNTQNPLFLKKSELGLVEPPNSELWHSAVYIDLAYNELSELPLSPDGHELKVLKLHNNVDLTKIPPLFFFKMPLLCVLDLSYTSVRELPNSFFELEQLRELYMKSCECFMKLSSEVGRLKNLEKIDLDKTQIIHLPKEIQELTNLQSLTLCFYEYRGKKSKEYTSSTVIPSGVISKLKGLKHLNIDVNPDDERWEENLQVILPEVLVLECLQTISLYIPTLELLNLIPAQIFELDFRFIVGRHMSRIISGTLPTAEEKFKQSERSLKFVKGVDVPYEIKRAVRHSKALFLDRHMTIKDLSKFGATSIEQLQVCILAECKEMQTIVDGRCSSSKDIVPRLLVLSVSYMKNLRSICEGEVHSSHSFGMLKTLALHNCPMLTTVFTLDFLGNLSLLTVLVVKDCPKISALISCGPSKLRAGSFLPKLRTMTLLHLPELINISNGFHMGLSLENLAIYDCPKLQRLSKVELSSQNLKVIKGETKWWEALTWSEAEWGIAGRPSCFECIFSPINKQVDIMSQMELDDDTYDSPGGIMGEPLQCPSVTNSSMNDQVDLRTQLGVDDDDDDDIYYRPALRHSSLRSSWTESKLLTEAAGEATLAHKPPV